MKQFPSQGIGIHINRLITVQFVDPGSAFSVTCHSNISVVTIKAAPCCYNLEIGLKKNAVHIITNIVTEISVHNSSGTKGAVKISIGRET